MALVVIGGPVDSNAASIKTAMRKEIAEQRDHRGAATGGMMTLDSVDDSCGIDDYSLRSTGDFNSFNTDASLNEKLISNSPKESICDKIKKLFCSCFKSQN